MTSREELRAKLHNKLRSRRESRGGVGSGPTRSGASGIDAGALMSLAGDDPAMNRLVHSALSNPKGAVRMLSKTLAQATAPAAEPASDASDEEGPPDSIRPVVAKDAECSDEEGLPPSMESGAD